MSGRWLPVATVFFTRDLSAALKQPMVVTAGELSAARLTAKVSG